MNSIIIVDHEKEFRGNLIKNLEAEPLCEVVGEGGDGYDALRLVENLKPDIAILESELPLLDAIKISPSIKLRSPNTAIIVLLDAEDDKTIIEVLKEGLSGCLMRESVLDEINLAIQEISERGHYFSKSIGTKAFKLMSKVVEKVPPASAKPGTFPQKDVKIVGCDTDLNKVETAIVRNLGDGFSNKEIAGNLELREGTVRNYISSILEKTGLGDRTQVAIFSIRTGYTDGQRVIEIVKEHKRVPAASAHRHIC